MVRTCPRCTLSNADINTVCEACGARLTGRPDPINGEAQGVEGPPVDERAPLLSHRRGRLAHSALLQDNDDDDDDDDNHDRRARPHRSILSRASLCCRDLCGGHDPSRGILRILTKLAPYLVGLMVLLFILSWDSLQPTEYGLITNRWTGTVDTSRAYEGGIYFVGPARGFIRFPSTRQTLRFAADTEFARSDAPAILCRTGRDMSDPDSGGQPVSLSVALQYTLPKDSIGDIYTKFALEYPARLSQFAMQVISVTAQKYHPEQFWEQRLTIAKDVDSELAKALGEQAHVQVTEFQMLKVDFLKRFEDTIVAIQLAVQQRTTQEYQQQVVKVLKEIDVMGSQTAAQVMAIGANASASAFLMENQARAQGFNHTQAYKSTNYAQISKKLGLSTPDLLKYLQVKSVNTHTGEMTVGL